jgi:NAD(P)-dependent dehydrogenase (short-subunit alcohol dehydrogenase family)
MTGLGELTGKVAVVTGGASGIGLGMARRMKAAGMRVVIADIEQAALSAAARELDVMGVRTDVASLESVTSLATQVVAACGAVHVVCNNAGIGPMGRIEELTYADWKWMLDVNLWGVIHGVHVFLPLLKKNADGGHIVNTSSMAGLAAVPGQGAYCVTKFGIVALSETLAQELAAQGSKVGVSILCPGPVRTRINTGSRNRPASAERAGLSDVNLDDLPDLFPNGVPYVEPDAVGDLVVAGIRRGDLYILTHPELFAFVADRHAAIDAAVRAHLERRRRQ